MVSGIVGVRTVDEELAAGVIAERLDGVGDDGGGARRVVCTDLHFDRDDQLTPGTTTD